MPNWRYLSDWILMFGCGIDFAAYGSFSINYNMNIKRMKIGSHMKSIVSNFQNQDIKISIFFYFSSSNFKLYEILTNRACTSFTNYASLHVNKFETTSNYTSNKTARVLQKDQLENTQKLNCYRRGLHYKNHLPIQRRNRQLSKNYNIFLQLNDSL